MILACGELPLDLWTQEKDLRELGTQGRVSRAGNSLDTLAQGQPCLYIAESPNFLSILPSYSGIMRTINFFAYNLFLPNFTRNAFSTQNVCYISYLS